jgi:ABC-type glycerol-3-phosphate transport system permease component
MFCQYCGSTLDEGARFCKSCGNPAPAPTTAPQIAAPHPAQVLSHHVHVLGIVWLAYGAFRIITAAWILAFSHYFLPAMQEVLSHSNAPFPFPIVNFLRAIYAVSAVYGVATGSFGIYAGYALMQRKRSARAMVIVAAFVCVIIFPFGTAVAIYTLIKLMPENAAREYKQLVTPH